MRPALRSLNLSNAVAVAVYEAWRQAGIRGAPGELAEAAAERVRCAPAFGAAVRC